jgi:hydroxymethylpyrimidine pyrophosphatase-like HAD family hydrolase
MSSVIISGWYVEHLRKRSGFWRFHPKNLTKASAVIRSVESLGLNREDTFAFGDSFNDIEILQYCQTGIAMGNAADELKAVADYVTSDVTDDGVFKLSSILA